MGIKVDWHGETKSIIEINCQQSWLWNELYQATDQAAKLMSNVDSSVDILFNCTQMPQGGGSAIAHFRRAMSLYPENWGIMIIISQNYMVRTVFSVFDRVEKRYKKQIFLMESQQEALEYIYSLRAASDHY